MIIYLEGNIGSGKSTLINFLQEYIEEKNIDADVILEPVEEWMKTEDSNQKYSTALLSGPEKIWFRISN